MADLFVIFDEEGIADRDPERTYRTYSDAFATMSEDNFNATFRLSKDAAREVCEAVKGDLERPQQWRRTTLSVEQRVLMALRFYATGAFLGNIAREESFVCSKHAISEALHAVSLAITMNLARKYLRFPSTPEEKLEVKRGFYELAEFPGCLGAIDGTQVAIQQPSLADPRFVDGNYYCHKGYHSINVLAVSNSRDSAYPLQPWLMTPVRTPTTQEEEDYNDAHSRTRVRIEHCFGMLKMRFRCLQRYRTLHFAPDRSCKIINACVVLHNMCITYNTPQLPDAGDAESGPDDDMTQEAHVAGADDAEDNDSAVATSSRATQCVWNFVTCGYKTVPLNSALQQGPQTPEQAL
ncbi:putative nuclease HARBI1 [Ornithodoros turicata]|uniref:putative nuclease HARBI1 n=1 Tax=Ornithodoros turicata TaxID=34597 RepID=UPI0031399D65